MLHIFRLFRLPNLLIIAVLQFLTAFFLQGNIAESEYLFFNAQKLIFLISATILIAAAGNVINDIQDIEIDSINKPGKVVIGKYILRKNALVLYGALNFTGLLLAGLVEIRFFIWNLIAAQILWLYSFVLKCKGIAGNLAVVFLMGLAVWVVQFAGNHFNFAILYFYMAFAFLTGLIREIIKDIEDKNGDLACGCNTFAAKNSIEKVKQSIFWLLLICGILLLYAGIFFIQNTNWYLGLYQIVIMFPLFVFFSLSLRKARETKQFSCLSLYIKLIMLAGILSIPLAQL
ncbi:MAG: hypothetical protein EOP53_11910 [Sphingobacteriales bacterium]|nr:MAG: hypothetical protein EOP53_11910 [Sphingobacteriales bacterium]